MTRKESAGWEEVVMRSLIRLTLVVVFALMAAAAVGCGQDAATPPPSAEQGAAPPAESPAATPLPTEETAAAGHGRNTRPNRPGAHISAPPGSHGYAAGGCAARSGNGKRLLESHKLPVGGLAVLIVKCAAAG